MMIHWPKPRLGRALNTLTCIGVVLLCGGLSSCKQSDVAQKFRAGAGQQEGLNSSSLLLFDRSPLEAYSGQKILASQALDKIVSKTPHVFRNISDIKAALRSDTLIVEKNHLDPYAPSFFNWAGKSIQWTNNTNYKAFFAYFYASKAIDYLDERINDLRGPFIADNQIAWREPILTGATFVAPNIFPLYLSVDNNETPEGAESLSTNTNYCSVFNLNFLSDGGFACLGWQSFTELSEAARESAFEEPNAFLAKKISFYEDADFSEFNPVDDGDIVAHEIFHALQDAIVPDVLGGESGINVQMDAIFEGSADFFVGALFRDTSVMNYSSFHLYEVLTDVFVGTLDGKTRDIDNTLVFPSAYLERSHDIGRVFSGALYDLVWTASGNTLRVFSAEDTCPLGSKDDSDCEVEMASLSTAEAFDSVMNLLIVSFVKLGEDPDREDVTFSKFGELMLETCGEMSTWCNQDDAIKVLQGRGLQTVHKWLDADPRLANFGDNPATKGIVLPDTLGWAPFMPGGSTAFANDDGFVDRCEAIYVFPNITNSSNTMALGGTATPTQIAEWNATAAKFRGTPIYEIEYRMSGTPSAPTGFDNFEHPTLGFIEGFAGVDNADPKGIPMLAPGESIMALATLQTSRLFGVYKNAEFDKPQSAKSASGPSERFKLRSPIGWLFTAGTAVGGTMALSFTVKYKAYDADYLDERSTFTDSDDGVLTNIYQTLEVDNTGTSFCQ